jgi:glucosyl-3-phosphoglycerate synthase
LYSADALINGLDYPRHDEELAVQTFVRANHEAAEIFPAPADAAACAPAWVQIAEEMPDFLPALRDAIAADSRARMAK